MAGLVSSVFIIILLEADYRAHPQASYENLRTFEVAFDQL
jgi:hypothetical protein